MDGQRRDAAGCKAIDTTKYPGGEIGWCMDCLANAPNSCGGKAASPNGKCHYHPGAPAGTRCRPDNGQP